MNRIQTILGTACHVALLVGCAQGRILEQSPSLVDPQARMYRMYYDQGTRSHDLAIRRFMGRVHLSEIEPRFGSVAALPRDSARNHVGGWWDEEAHVWRAVAGPTGIAVNLVTVHPDGTLSSALDLNGDGVADIVDVRLADERRFTLVTEAVGMEVLRDWLLGENPLCEERVVGGITLPAFGCDPGGGTAGPTSMGGGVYDFLEQICGERSGSPRAPSPRVLGHGFHPPGRSDLRHTRTAFVQEREGTTQLEYAVRTDTYRDENGEHVATFRTITFTDENGNITRVVHETVRGRGDGVRLVTDYGADGTTKRHEETFSTDPDTYIEDLQNSDPPEPISTGPETTHPGPADGPFGPDGDLAEWCDTRVPHRSGVERAASHDHTAFRIACDDLVRAGNGADCSIFEWARGRDFQDVLDLTNAPSECGPFEYPGPDGTCGATSTLHRLRGLTAELLSADLGPIFVCDPLVCRPGP